MIDRHDISGLILAGGQGSRMGGVDKGLQTHQGVPLAVHALLRLAPQVGPLMINANRNLAAYESFGEPVWTDVMPGFAGPLAGFMTGLEHASTAWVMTVPCDTPYFPHDMVARLAQAASREGVQLAMAAAMEDGVMRQQPVFCLMHVEVVEHLTRFMMSGGRKIDAWTAGFAHSVVPFDDARAFTNVNTLQELHDLQPPTTPA